MGLVSEAKGGRGRGGIFCVMNPLLRQRPSPLAQTLIFGLLVVYDFKVHLGDVFALKYDGMCVPQHGLRRKVDLAQLSVQVGFHPTMV